MERGVLACSHTPDGNPELPQLAVQSAKLKGVHRLQVAADRHESHGGSGRDFAAAHPPEVGRTCIDHAQWTRVEALLETFRVYQFHTVPRRKPDRNVYLVHSKLAGRTKEVQAAHMDAGNRVQIEIGRHSTRRHRSVAAVVSEPRVRDTLIAVLQVGEADTQT